MKLDNLCSTDRTTISRPFVCHFDDADWLCATNGYLLLAVKGMPPERDGDPGAPKVEKFLTQIRDATATKRFSMKRLRSIFPFVPRNPCVDCAGGKQPVTCETCNGDGQHKCPTCHTDHDCGPCGGTGQREPKDCPTCSGLGVIEPPSDAVEINETVVIDAVLIGALLDCCPDGKCDVGLSAKKGEPMIFFRGDGWSGLVMGLGGFAGKKGREVTL
jgi:hypothetical protein